MKLILIYFTWSNILKTSFSTHDQGTTSILDFILFFQDASSHWQRISNQTSWTWVVTATLRLVVTFWTAGIWHLQVWLLNAHSFSLHHTWGGHLLFLRFILFYYLFIYLCVCASAWGEHGCEQSNMESHEAGVALQVVVSHPMRLLRIKPLFPVRAILNILNCCFSSPSPLPFFPLKVGSVVAQAGLNFWFFCFHFLSTRIRGMGLFSCIPGKHYTSWPHSQPPSQRIFEHQEFATEPNSLSYNIKSCQADCRLRR